MFSRPGSPVVIQPPGFVPFAHKQRGALLLSNGVLYSPHESSNCDLGTYHGWIMAHDPTTLEAAQRVQRYARRTIGPALVQAGRGRRR